MLYIVGDSRSGSTLLHHLLALQNGVVGLGEVRRLEQIVRTGEPPCACGLPVEQCPFWGRIASLLGLSLDQIRTTPATRPLRRRYAQALGWVGIRLGLESVARRLLAQEQRAVTSCFNIYRAAGEVTGDRVIVDSSKFASQFLHLYLEGTGLVRPIFLVRDGRAVVWSQFLNNDNRLKKGKKGFSVAQLSRQWRNVSMTMLIMQKAVAASASDVVHYEELCRAPTKVLQGILDRVNVTVHSTDLRSLPNVRHDLGGSPRFRKESPEKIELDERWRNEMPKEALATFERIAGPMNRRLGYA